ncbi:MAG: 3TM-type holin [Nitrosopumilus sp.]
MGLFSIVGGLLKPLIGMVDDLSTSDEERLQLKLLIDQVQSDLAIEALKFEAQLAEYKSSIIIAEAQSGNWLTTMWRPLTMLTFVVLIVMIAAGIMDTEALAAVPDRLWTLITLGISGYIGGRSAEKIVPRILAASKKKQDA